MLMQFKAIIVSLFMAASTGVPPPAINIGNIDNLKEMACMAQAIHGEAANQSFEGKVAIAYVIKNRTENGQFPEGICEVINQKGQFHFAKNRRINEKDEAVMAQIGEDIEAAYAVMNGEVEDPTKGALYFINPKVCKDRIWRIKYKLLAKIDGHNFYIRKA